MLKVALEESEREVKKIPLMISYSEKRISLLEDILTEYKHEAMVNGGGPKGMLGGMEARQHPPPPPPPLPLFVDQEEGVGGDLGHHPDDHQTHRNGAVVTDSVGDYEML